MALTPVLQPLDQTSEFAVVRNTVSGADVVIAPVGDPGNPIVSQRIENLDLGWTWVAHAWFGALGDELHDWWQGDFTGSGTTEILFYSRGDHNWWLGTTSGTALTWRAVGNTGGFGDLRDGQHRMWVGDFTGANRLQVLMHYGMDGHWWLGTVAGGVLTWTFAGDTSGFGDLLDGAHSIWIGDFNGAGRQEVLFHYSGDGHWFLGTIAAGALTWQLAGNTIGFGDLLDGRHPIWFGDFAGSGKEQALFYYAGDGRWWLGTITNGAMTWDMVAANQFGNLLDGHHPVWIGDFTGAGRADLLFYYADDGNWWLGSMAGAALTWQNVANNKFGDLLDNGHRVWQGDFAGLGKQQILFYYNGDGNWWFGRMTGAALTWTLAVNTAGFGNLLDGRHQFFQGEFSGNGRSSLLFYYNADGNWWHGQIDGAAMSWWLSGNTRGFGDLLDGQHRTWTGKYTGPLKTEILFHYLGDGNFYRGQLDGAHLRLPRALEPGEEFQATQTIGGAPSMTSDPVLVGHNFATQHYDRQRTGWNSREKALTAKNVHALQRLYTMTTDDQVYAQPLYVQGVRIAGAAHDVIYVATESDTIYAFDARSNTQLLRKTLLRPGESPVPSADIYDEVDAHLNIFPLIGITGTPVIDRATNTLFVVSKSKDSQGHYHQRLHALDLETLGERPCVTEITASFGPAQFDPLASNQRPALLLSRGMLYVGFGSHGDQHGNFYFGWLLAYDARTLNLQGVFNAAPAAGGEAGIWQSGHGPAADADGYVYCTTGNGAFSTVSRNFSNCVLKLDDRVSLVDFFAPLDQPFLNMYDMDLGSGGILVLPDQPNAPHHLLLTGGKQGYIYLLDRDGLGGEEQKSSPKGVELYPGHLSHQAGNPAGSDASQVGMFGGPAYFRNSSRQFVFLCGTGGENQGQLVRFQLVNGSLTNRQQSVRQFPSSATPSVTGTAGRAVVWLVDRGNPLKLVAFAANDLTNTLFEQEAGRWTNPQGTAFVLPTVFAGRVYVPSSDGVAVFGL